MCYNICWCGVIKLVSKREKIKWVIKKKWKIKGKQKHINNEDVESVGLERGLLRDGPIRKTTWNNWKNSTYENKMGCVATWNGTMPLKWS